MGNSAYLVSKLALAKTIEFLAQENLNVFFASIHPGMVGASQHGRTVWSNWDVTELKAMSESIFGKLKIGLVGWPFTAQ